jgi:Subtilase family
MKNLPIRKATLGLIFAGFLCAPVQGQNLDQIGLTILRAVTTNLNGAGIRVAQPEASYDLGTNWEVNPAAAGQPVGLFTYISANGSTTNFPNFLSSESGHADGVAGNFYGMPGGVATNVAQVDNYDGNYFFDSIIASPLPANINDPVVNQSFIFTESDGSHATVSDQQAIDSAYDDYTAQFATLFISGAGNGGTINPPATCYNGIGVGVSDGSSSAGPTIDNGRAKPDIIAPGGATSFSTPYVAGAAAVLMQAALRGDGGSDTNSATNLRTIKALLLNGAIKPANWTNNSLSPLDTRYGAGVLNVLNSYMQLTGGKHGYIESTTVPAGGAHPPTGATGTLGILSGWDFNTNTSSFLPSAQDGVKHYYFNLTNAASNPTFTATATLVWNRQQTQTGINNLDLFLYNAANSNLVACSTSRVDNVEHLWLPQLPPGRYDLQVLMNASGIDPVNNSEAYALAWEFFSASLNIAKSAANISVTWPVYPAGFTVVTTTNLAPANWVAFTNVSAVITNQQNQLRFNPASANQFFRLQRP